jgi:hypothetical protein
MRSKHEVQSSERSESEIPLPPQKKAPLQSGAFLKLEQVIT